MSAVLKCNIITACVISAINLLLNGAIAYEGNSKVKSYKTYGKTIANATDNFDPTSEWFTTLSSEYENLSDFDKEYVYCDVDTILADPSGHYDDSTTEVNTTAMCIILTFGGLLVVLIQAGCAKCNPFYGVDMADIGPEDPEKGIMSKAVILKSHKPMTPAEKMEADLSNFRYNTVALFFMTGPCIGMFWLLIESRSSVSGLDCQEMFYECGRSGECTIDDLMTTVPLNSSVIKMLISYPLIASGCSFGLLSLVYILAAGVYVSILSRSCKWMAVPAFWSVYSLVPSVWVLFLDGKVPVEGLLGIMIIAIAPVVIWLLGMCWFCYLSCRGYDLKTGRKKEGFSICCSC